MSRRSKIFSVVGKVGFQRWKLLFPSMETYRSNLGNFCFHRRKLRNPRLTIPNCYLFIHDFANSMCLLFQERTELIKTKQLHGYQHPHSCLQIYLSQSREITSLLSSRYAEAPLSMHFGVLSSSNYPHPRYTSAR